MKQVLDITSKWWYWIIASFVLYANTMNHQYVVDDQIVVTRNTLTQQGVEGIPEIFKHSYLFGYDQREDESYRPLVLTSFAIEKSFFNADPTMSHFIQVLLYGIAVLLLFRLLNQIFGEEKKILTVLITFLFLIHPIHTEVVANVKSRDEILCAIFLFASLNQYLKWIVSNKALNLVFTVVLYFFAALSKETAIPSIILFPVFHLYLNSPNVGSVLKRSVILIIPLIIYISIRYIVLSDVLIKDPIDPVANSLALAENGIEAFASNLSIFSKYIQLSIFPIFMSWDYSVSQLPIFTFSNPTSLLGLVLVLFILIIAILGLLKRKIYGLGAVVFIATFVATSNFFFLINCPLGERFLFIPVLGILLILTPILFDFFKSRNLHMYGIATLYGLAGFFIFRTITRNADWKDNISIYESGVKVCPNSVKTHFNLGTEYITQGNLTSNGDIRQDWYEKAISSLDRARKVYPEYVNIYENTGYTYSELAKLATNNSEKITLLLKGRNSLSYAIDSLGYDKEGLFKNLTYILTELASLQKDSLKKGVYYQELFELMSKKRNYNAEDFHQQIFALTQMKKYDELVTLIEEKAIKYPEKIDLIAELSKQGFNRQDYDFSLRMIEIYLKVRPDDLSTLSNKGMLFEIMGKKQEALSIYEEILEKDPNQLHTRDLYEKLKSSVQ